MILTLMFQAFLMAAANFGHIPETVCGGMTLPAMHYLKHPPKYIPNSPAYPFANELATMQAITAPSERGGFPSMALVEAGFRLSCTSYWLLAGTANPEQRVRTLIYQKEDFYPIGYEPERSWVEVFLDWTQPLIYERIHGGIE